MSKLFLVFTIFMVVGATANVCNDCYLKYMNYFNDCSHFGRFVGCLQNTTINGTKCSLFYPYQVMVCQYCQYHSCDKYCGNRTLCLNIRTCHECETEFLICGLSRNYCGCYGKFVTCLENTYLDYNWYLYKSHCITNKYYMTIMAEFCRYNPMCEDC